MTALLLLSFDITNDTAASSRPLLFILAAASSYDVIDSTYARDDDMNVYCIEVHVSSALKSPPQGITPLLLLLLTDKLLYNHPYGRLLHQLFWNQHGHALDTAGKALAIEITTCGE